MSGIAGRRVVAPTLVGRSEELGQLAEALATPPVVAVVEGEAGVGKTRLVTELASRAELSELRFLAGGGRQIREPLPLGPVVEALRGVAADLRPHSLSPVAGALRPLLPELAGVLPPATEPLADRSGQRYLVFRALAEVLAALGPAVLVVEDAHWVDEQTVDFLGYLLGDELPSRLRLLLTYRGEDVSPEVRALTAKLPAAVGRTQLTLKTLDVAATGALSAAILGVARVSEDFAAYLWRRTSGLPFAVEELVALLQARGTLVRDGGGQWIRQPLEELDQLDVPAGIRDHVLERVSRLPPAAQQVVASAAVLQTPVPAGVLTATCPLAAARTLPGVEQALESGVLTVRGDAVGFRHVLAAQAVYEGVAPPRRQQLHVRAAVALRALDPVPWGRVAHHLRHAGRLAEWADAAEAAADQVSLAFRADEETARLLGEVLRHAPLDPQQRDRLALKLGRAAEGTRQSGPAAEVLMAVLAQGPGPDVRGELQLRLALMLNTHRADPTRERRLWTAAAAELTDPELKARAMLGLANPTCAGGVPLAEHQRWLHGALTLVPEVADPSRRTFLYGKAAMVAVAMGDPRWRQLAALVLERASDQCRDLSLLNACGFAGYAVAYAGEHALAGRLLDLGREAGAGLRPPRVELKYRSVLALLNYLRGAWVSLPGEVDVLRDELAGYPTSRVDPEAIAGGLALAGGDLERADRLLTSVVGTGERVAGLDVLSLAVPLLVRVALAGRAADRALAVATQFVAALERKGMWAPAYRALPAIVAAQLAADRPGEARDLVDLLAGESARLDAPHAVPALAYARGLLAAAGRRPAAAGHLLAAADVYQRLHCPYEEAQAREQAAACRFAQEESGAEQLRAALVAYQQLGAAWDLARAAGTARRHGVPVPARHRGGRRGYGGDLTPRERKVAELAAAGHTNKEIGERLFLSPRTIDTHLTSVRRKLGVHTRAALAHRLHPEAAGHHGA